MRKKIIIGFCLVAIAIAVALLWPTARYDINRVHPSLRTLAMPFQSADAGSYLDGGSIGITIVDRDSNELKLALPVSSQPARSYPRLFIGATHISKSNAVEVAFSEDTRRMLIAVLEDHRLSSNYNVLALVALRGAPRDYARLGGRAVLNSLGRR